MPLTALPIFSDAFQKQIVEEVVMIKYKTCIRCNSENIELLKINSRLNLNAPEKKDRYSGRITQTVYNPTDAILCKDCGHVELLIDWNSDIQ